MQKKQYNFIEFIHSPPPRSTHIKSLKVTRRKKNGRIQIEFIIFFPFNFFDPLNFFYRFFFLFFISHTQTCSFLVKFVLKLSLQSFHSFIFSFFYHSFYFFAPEKKRVFLVGWVVKLVDLAGLSFWVKKKRVLI